MERVEDRRVAPGAHIAAIELIAELLAGLDGPFASDVFYGRLCDAICRLTAMDRALIFSYDADLRRVRAVGAHGLDLARFQQAHITLAAAPAARVALVEDRVVELSAADHDGLPAGFLDEVEGRRLSVCPMAASGRWVGLVLCDRPATGPPLGDDERELLWTLGKTAALATVARMSTHQSERARALQGRLDMAREIHDGVVQRLFGVSLALGADGPLPDEARERVADEVQTALSELRAALGRPLAREARPTRTTLREELVRLAAEHPDLGLEVDEGSAAVEVPREAEALSVSVLAEAVRNVRKHADPTRVQVRLRHQDGAFLLDVANDGVRPRGTDGGPAAALAGTGMGLRLAAFEALQTGGVLEFGPRGDASWQVRLVVPDDQR